MGFAKGLIGSLVGGSKQSAPIQVQQSTSNQNEQSPDQIEEERRRRLVAMNQQGSGGQMTPAGGAPGSAPVVRKMLFGL